MLDGITIERFKAAFKPGLVQLRPFTVIIGRNGSGKSTLLEALQWLDTTMRHDARRASERYYGVGDLINLRTQTSPGFFKLKLTWTGGTLARPVTYEVRVQQDAHDDHMPRIAREQLSAGKRSWIGTEKGGTRVLFPKDQRRRVPFHETDRLALARGGSPDEEGGSDPLAVLRDFWTRAVFLRLSPNRLAAGSPARRASFEPLLDEEGHNLPALLTELDRAQRKELVSKVRDVLPDIVAVKVEKPRAGRDVRINYLLSEKMPYVGRAGLSTFDIPAWMLSEGTRRITALLALLVHSPPPSLLCVEEIENGLDPWTVKTILAELQAASDRGIQVVLTTHSPWLLDHVLLEDIIHVRREQGETRYLRFAHRDEIREFAAAVPPGTRYVTAP
ncbi:MAG TPA: ATP-binding protein [Polyangia bacterium]|jgi:predicted ATPase